MVKNFVCLFGLFICILLLSDKTFSQIVEGRVMEVSESKELAYVNISVPGTSHGTVSKFDGSYRMDLTDLNSEKDSIVFSIIGYERKSMSIDQLRESPFVYLSPMSFNLESVIVSPKSPEEIIQMAIENIPENYIKDPFNGTIYYRSEMRLNGMFIESCEAIMKGYIMPVVNNLKDTTRLKMLAFKYFDEQEEAINSITIKKRKKEKVALEGLDTMLIALTYQLSEYFGVYTQIDSNLIKQLHLKGYKKGKEKYWFENMVHTGERDLMKIGFKGRIKMASEIGNILFDEESLSFAAYNYQAETANLKIKALLWLLGIGFKSADAVIRVTSRPSEYGWIPDVIEVNVFVDMEKNKWFRKDIPMVMELTSHMSFLEIESPPTDKCLDGMLIHKKKHLKEQFKSDPESIYWKEYEEVISKKKVR